MKDKKLTSHPCVNVASTADFRTLLRYLQGEIAEHLVKLTA